MSAFGPRHVVSKGSPKLGLKMIGAYGKKPSTSMSSLRSATAGTKARKTSAVADRDVDLRATKGYKGVTADS
jgi:hypothetical protein